MTRDNTWVWVSCRASFQDLVDQLCHSQKNGQDKHPETGSWDKDNTTGRDIERRHTVLFSEVVSGLREGCLVALSEARRWRMSQDNIPVIHEYSLLSEVVADW